MTAFVRHSTIWKTYSQFVRHSGVWKTFLEYTKHLGVWKPTKGPATPISKVSGTTIGSFTSNGGMAAAQDGNTNQDNSASAVASANGTGRFIGKTFAVPTAIDTVDIWGANNGGYVHSANPSMSIELRAKQGAYSGTITDYTTLGTTGTFTDTATTNTKTIASSDKDTYWDHAILVFLQSTSDTSRVAEFTINGWQ